MNFLLECLKSLEVTGNSFVDELEIVYEGEAMDKVAKLIHEPVEKMRFPTTVP